LRQNFRYEKFTVLATNSLPKLEKRRVMAIVPPRLLLLYSFMLVYPRAIRTSVGVRDVSIWFNSTWTPSLSELLSNLSTV